jgi:hypothetical protein
VEARRGRGASGGAARWPTAALLRDRGGAEDDYHFYTLTPSKNWKLHL